ncbi:hypothetical protein BH10PSE16_BH10PSE16_43420 [soil metagenome]
MADPKIKYDIEAAVSGTASVDALEKTLRGLAGTLDGDLKTKALSAADALKALGEKQQAIESFKALKLETNQVSQALTAADRTLQTLAVDLRTAQTSTQGLTAAQTAAAVVLSDAKNKLAEQRAALVQLRSDYTGAARSTDAYKDANNQLRTSIADLRTGLKQKTDDLRAAAAGAKAAEQSEGALSAEYERAQGTARKLSADIGEKTRALEASRAALKAAGIETTGLAQTEKALAAAVTGVKTQVGDLDQALKHSAATAAARKLASDEMRESDRLLAIQARTLAAEIEEGRIALLAENAAQLDAAAVTRKMQAAKEAQAAAQRSAAEAARIAAETWQREAFALVEAAEAAARAKRAADLLTEAERFLAAETARVTLAQQAAAAAQKQMADAAAAAAQELKNAFGTLGVRSAKDLQAEIDKVNAAMNLVRSSGTTTGAALAAAMASGDVKVKELERDMRALNGALTIGDKAAAAAQELKNAFGTIGVRSAKDLQAEIDKVNAAMNLVRSSGTTTGAALNSAFATGEAKIKALERELRAVNSQLTLGDRAATMFSGSMGQITAGNVVANGIGYLTNKVRELGAEFLASIVSGDQMQRGLMAIYKDSGVVASQIDFLKKSSSESGVAFGGLTKEFVKFSASMKSANIPLADSNNLFKAVSATTAALGLGMEATAGTLNALGQMASKGTVSMEELRAQLGDRLPGAIGLTAKGLGITESQLVSLVSSGQLATRDFIVPFTEGLRSMQGESDGLVPAWERLKGLFSQLAQGAGDAGAVVTLTSLLKILGAVVGGVALSLSLAVEGFFLFGAASAAAGARLRGDTQAWEKFSQKVAESGKRLGDQKDSLVNFIAPAQAATEAMTTHTASVTASIQANTSLSSAQKLAALSTALAADASLNAASKIVQYGVAATELLKLQEKQTEAYAKSANAAKQQGDTLVALAKLTGNVAAIQAASTQAAELHSVALEKVAKSQADETVILVAQKAELEKSQVSRKLTALDIKTQADALEKLIVQSKAETEQSKRSAEAAAAELFQRKLSTETYQDNSKSIDGYRDALKRAQAWLEIMISFNQIGEVSEKALMAAREAVTRTTVLLKDAEHDRTVNQELLISAIATENTLEQASLLTPTEN